MLNIHTYVLTYIHVLWRCCSPRWGGIAVGVHNNVPHEFSVSLFCEHVVKTCFASLVERMRSCVFRGADERIQQCKPMIGRNEKGPLTIIVECISAVCTDSFTILTPKPSSFRPSVPRACWRPLTQIAVQARALPSRPRLGLFRKRVFFQQFVFLLGHMQQRTSQSEVDRTIQASPSVAGR